MNNPTPTPDQDPAPGNVPAQNPIIAETPSSQVYTAPHIDNPPPPKIPFLSSKIVLLIVILLILLGLSGTYLALNSKLKPASISTTPTPLPTEASAKAGTPIDETASWKTYINKGGYSVKYPASWIIQETVEENFSCILLVEEISKGMTICFSTEKFLNVWPEYASKSGKMKITISGYDAYENTISPGAFFLLNSRGQFASIQGSLLDKRIFDQILSTFKFIDSTEPVVCTQDAKLCPDGSYVGRQGPNCEFSPCPSN